MINNLSWSSCKVPFILGGFYRNLNFLTYFRQNTQISNFMKIRSVGDELFHVDGQTDRPRDRHDVANSRFLWTHLQIAHFLSVLRLLTICGLGKCLHISHPYKIYQASYVFITNYETWDILKCLHSVGVFKRKNDLEEWMNIFNLQ
jgi:hypothetical protein